MEILLILLLPLMWALSNIMEETSESIQREFKRQKLEKKAKREMWTQERIDRWWEKEMELRSKLYFEIFGEEHEYMIEKNEEKRREKNRLIGNVVLCTVKLFVWIIIVISIWVFFLTD